MGYITGFKYGACPKCGSHNIQLVHVSKEDMETTLYPRYGETHTGLIPYYQLSCNKCWYSTMGIDMDELKQRWKEGHIMSISDFTDFEEE